MTALHGAEINEVVSRVVNGMGSSKSDKKEGAIVKYEKKSHKSMIILGYFCIFAEIFVICW